MSAMHSEIREAFRDLGAADDKALKAASVLGSRDEDLAGAVTDIEFDIAGVTGEQIVHRWIPGVILATNVAVVFRLPSH